MDFGLSIEIENFSQILMKKENLAVLFFGYFSR